MTVAERWGAGLRGLCNITDGNRWKFPGTMQDLVTRDVLPSDWVCQNFSDEN